MLEDDGFCRGDVVRALEEVVEGLGRAMITTIHGFCDRLLRGWGEEAGSGRWVSEEEKKRWLEEFLVEGGGLQAFEVDVVSRKYRHDQKALVERLVTLMEDAQVDDAWERAATAAGVVREKCRGRNVADCLMAKARGYRGNMQKDGSAKDEVVRACAALQRIVVDGLTEEVLEGLLGFSLPACFETPLAKRSAVDADVEHVVHTVVEELWPAVAELVDGENIVRRLAARAARAFGEFVEKSGRKTPDAVIRRVCSLSEDTEFLAYAAGTVEWLIVDEFQDTDETQYLLLSRLFLDNPLWHGHVLFVGDPKQAIYGFRNADVYSYLAAKNALLPDEVRTLAVNYRADSNVVDAQNRLFAGPEQRWVFYLPRAMTSLAVVPSTAGRVAAGLVDGRGALHLFVAHHCLGRKRRWPHEDLENEGLFPWIADEIQALEKCGIAYRRQAILVKDRYQARRVQKYLAGRGIFTCAWRVDHVTDSPVYQWLQKAFALAIRPNDLRRLSSLLLTLPTEDHLTLCQSIVSGRRLDQWAMCATAWCHVRDAFQNGGIAAMARELFSCRWDGRTTVEEWLRAMPEGSQLLIDLEHLFELLSLLGDMLPHALEAYAGALADLSGHFSEDIESLVRRVDPDDGGVPILTMHRSKGLEFDVVYALGCGSRTPPEEATAGGEGDAEKLRQLYVAVTRAKRRCYLPLCIDDDEKAVPLGRASPVELLFAALSARGEPSPSWSEVLYGLMSGASLVKRAEALCSDLPHAITMSDVMAERRHVPPVVRPRTAVAVQQWATPICQRRTYRSFSSGEYCLTLRGMGGRIPQPGAKSFPSSARSSSPALFGARFHEAIAKLLFAPPEARQSPEAVATWLNGAADGEMAQLLYDAATVRLPLDGEEVCLEDVPREAMRAECAFVDREDGDRYVRGVLDLVFVWKGAVYVVDWKTHSVEGGRCRDVVEQGYELQHRLYLEAVVRALSAELRYGGFFFVFVRHVKDGGIVGECRGGDGA